MSTDWNAISIEFVSGVESYRALAHRHGLKEATVRQRASREGWQARRHELSQSVTAKAQDALTSQRVGELAKFNEDDLKIAKEIREKAQAMMGADLKPADLKALSGAVKDAQIVGRLALGASTENSTVTTKELPASVTEFV
jgi:hypothetical protein